VKESHLSLFNKKVDRSRIYENLLRSSKKQVLVGLAFCFYIVWAVACCVGPDLTFKDTFPFLPLSPLPSWLGYLFFFVLASVVIAIYCKRAKRILESKKRYIFFGCTMGAAVFLHALWVFSEADTSGVLYVIAGIFFGIGGALFRLEMGRLFAWIGAQQTVYQGGAGVLVSTGILLVFMCLPDILFFIAVGITSTLAVACGWFYSKRLSVSRYFQSKSHDHLKIPLKLIATSFVQGVSMGLVYLWIFLLGFGSLSKYGFFLAIALAFLALVASLVFLRFDFNRGIYKFAFPGLAAGFVLLSFFPSNPTIGLIVILIGFCFLDITLWSLGACLAKNMGISSPWIASLTGAALAAGVIVGAFVGISGTTEIIETPAYLSVFGLLIACILLAVALLFSSQTNLKYGWGSIEPDNVSQTADRLANVVQFLSREHGLTNRESEVFLLLAKGKSRRFMGNDLYISPDTIKTHVKNVYKKLSVHSQLELIDLVELEKEKVEPDFPSTDF